MNLDEIQSTVSQFCSQVKIDIHATHVHLLDLGSELGELTKEYLLGTQYGSQPFKKTDKWDDELGDVIFALICVANSSQTHIDHALTGALNKYKKRILETGVLSSSPENGSTR